MTEILDTRPIVKRIAPWIGGRSASFPRAVTISPRAVTISPNKIEIYLGRVEVDRKKLHMKDCELTGATVHEMTHSYRESLFPSSTKLIERIASEGLAYFAQSKVEQEVFGVPFEDTLLNDNLDGENLLNLLYADPTAYLEFAENSDWLYGHHKEPYSWGQRLGIWCVKSWSDDYGYDFSTLIQMPPEELLAI